MTSSIASLKGDGVRPGTAGEWGAGECPLEMAGYRSFMEGAGEGVRAGRVLYATLCGGGAGGGGEEPKFSMSSDSIAEVGRIGIGDVGLEE